MKRIIITFLFILASLSFFLLSKSQSNTIKVETIPDGYINMNTEEFYNNYIDMRQVTNFEATETGLHLYTADGNGYYWEYK